MADDTITEFMQDHIKDIILKISVLDIDIAVATESLNDLGKKKELLLEQLGKFTTHFKTMQDIELIDKDAIIDPLALEAEAIVLEKSPKPIKEETEEVIAEELVVEEKL